jgi:DNA invertase Pin-like site-specific DNA recombinase
LREREAFLEEITNIAAAQYVRMSTKDQQYSIDNQTAAINKFAEQHRFSVIRTYSDAGKSGVVLKHRPALAQLLKDVVGGGPPFKASLVYDISR